MKNSSSKKIFLVRMLRTLQLIAQNLNKLQNMEPLLIKKRYRYDKDVHDDACFEDNEENSDSTSLDNNILSKAIYIYNKLSTYRY